jgi:hypothetical protein
VDRLTLRWDGPNKLTIIANGLPIDRNHINVLRWKAGDIEIGYENIAGR